MKDKSHMPISEFSRITGIKSENLRYYDQIKLLSPEFRGENGYRYYTRSQLNTAYLIISLREIGIGIDEIRKYIENRTPEKMFSLFKDQETHILEEIKKLQITLEIMRLYTNMADTALKYEEEGIFIEYKKKEPILLGPILTDPYTDDSFISFYDFAYNNGFELGYPLGSIVSKDNLASNQPLVASRYFFKLENSENSYKPKGKYAVIYGRCAYGKSDDLYKKLLSFIKENNLEICSDAYEEYPLNELSIVDENKYCVRIEIMVKPSYIE
ncbi:DNA-binding transcriptional regulator, MerR family [Clostridium collagenovorans DSM 3089]|uniref:DNA-binding transcriptional regulator, MerR family n=1 Tax=Clostridium collagenovorans DSM 3089 TaxID=1121306 RepID=A0A1M5VCI7_9CLOT|nr:MerR family transcriptional regulator [Clostridium collagenovorans]SHH72947.1 DNA-binding transcriptional regulator, MerR family [Clostridium collagenovorans DSM 3089]